jgi:hypothetical protein
MLSGVECRVREIWEDNKHQSVLYTPNFPAKVEFSEAFIPERCIPQSVAAEESTLECRKCGLVRDDAIGR